MKKNEYHYSAKMITLVGSLLLAMTGGVAHAQEEATAVRVEQVKTLLEKFYETQRLISEEESNWQMEKETLASRIELLQTQIDSLQEKITEAEETTTEADKDKAKLSEENEELGQLASMQEERIVEFEARVRELRERLPKGLQVSTNSLFEKLPAEDAEMVEASLGQRFATVLGILDGINQYNNGVWLLNEERKTADGKVAEVRVAYFGLAEAYYAGKGEAASAAGYGYAGEDGWVWIYQPEISDRVNDMIDMYEQTKTATFLELPMQVK
ncbi:MAG: DUF3450 family protein [Verrucomicrobiota bacterium]